MRFLKFLLGAVVLLHGLVSAAALAEEPSVAGAEYSSELETPTMVMLRSLYYEGGVTLDINFDNDKAALPPNSKSVVDVIVQIMNVNPALELIIECYTDNTGNQESSRKLSENRAKAVKAAIVAQGIDANRLSAIGHSQTKNSRVELVVKSIFPPAVQADEHFGIKVYPGAKLNDEQTKFARNISGLDAFIYVTQDDFKKVSAFYEKLEGFMNLGADETAAVFMKDVDGRMITISISSHWLDSRTGEEQSTTSIQLLGD